jgi:hypothetical protein
MSLLIIFGYFSKPNVCQLFGKSQLAFLPLTCKFFIPCIICNQFPSGKCHYLILIISMGQFSSLHQTEILNRCTRTCLLGLYEHTDIIWLETEKKSND